MRSGYARCRAHALQLDGPERAMRCAQGQATVLSGMDFKSASVALRDRTSQILLEAFLA